MLKGQPLWSLVIPLDTCEAQVTSPAMLSPHVCWFFFFLLEMYKEGTGSVKPAAASDRITSKRKKHEGLSCCSHA